MQLNPTENNHSDSGLLQAENIIEAALLTQSEALNEQALCKICEPALTEEQLHAVIEALKQRWQRRALK